MAVALTLHTPRPYLFTRGIAGNFPGPSSTQKNLVLVDGKTGEVIRWFDDAPTLKSVLAAPGLGRVYGGGRSLSAFEFSTGKRLWTKAKTEVDPTIRTHDSKPDYRDLELDANGKTIWAACICDKVDAKPAKALVKLDTEGNHDASWLTQAGTGTFGQSIVDHNGKLYLAAGGSDFLAEFDKTAKGARGWVRDTSGSAQAVAVLDGQLVVGGHFYYVGDDKADKCGAGRPGEARLDPNGDCQLRQGIAAYSLGGQLDPDWHPAYSGSYSLVWVLHVEGARLHTGGEFKTVSGVTQTSYARLSPDSIEGNERPNTLVGTRNDDAIYGYGGADRIDGWGGDDTLRLGGGMDKGRGGVATTISVRWTGARTTSTVALVQIASKRTRGTTSLGDARESQGLAGRSARPRIGLFAKCRIHRSAWKVRFYQERAIPIDSLRLFSELTAILHLFGARRLSQQDYTSFPEP